MINVQLKQIITEHGRTLPKAEACRFADKNKLFLFLLCLPP